MPYDHETPYGTTHGNMTPYELMQAQTLMKMHADMAAQTSQESADRAKRMSVPYGSNRSFEELLDDPALPHAAPAGAAGGGASPLPPIPAPQPGPQPAPRQDGYGEYGTEQYFNNRAMGRSAKDVQLGNDQMIMDQQNSRRGAADELKRIAGLSGPASGAPGDIPHGGGFTEGWNKDGSEFSRTDYPGDSGTGAGAAVARGDASTAGGGISDDEVYRRAMMGWIASGENGPMPDVNAIKDASMERQRKMHQYALQDALDAAKNKAAMTGADLGSLSKDDLTTNNSLVAQGKTQAEAAEAIQQMHSYGAIQPQVKDALDRVKKFIRENNWSIAGNGPELNQLYHSVIKRMHDLGATPKAQGLLMEDLKNAMRDALGENGMLFESAGSDQVRQDYGL